MKTLALRIREAGPWGFGLFALAAVAVALFVASHGFNPVEQGEDHVAEPVANTLGIVNRLCPDNWEETSSRDEHSRVLSCEKDGWLVVLTPTEQFDYAIHLDTPGSDFEKDATKVPGWK